MNDTSNFLPADGFAGTLVGRAWLPGAVPGPAVVAIRADGVHDLSAVAATMSSQRFRTRSRKSRRFTFHPRVWLQQA